MSGNTTQRMIAAYFQQAEPTAYFSGKFQARPENFHASEQIEIDIVRSTEEVSIVVDDLTTGYRMNSNDLYTNKGFKPPVHKEAVPINSYDLIKRTAGENPFQNPDFRANIITRAFDGVRKVERKIRRAIEWQSAQVLQTGVVTLSDINGVARYTLNFGPKSTHFPTSGVSWATATTVQKLADIQALSDVIRSDGLADPDELTFGQSAWEALAQDSGFLLRMHNRRMNFGEINPMQKRGDGGIYRGTIEIGNYSYDVYTYNGRYAAPQGGASTPFMAAGKVLMRASSGRMDATFGAIPNIGALLGQSARLLPELPGRMSSPEQGVDLFTNVWLSEDGEQLFAGLGSRPLMVPTAIDTYGCLNTQLT